MTKDRKEGKESTPEIPILYIGVFFVAFIVLFYVVTQGFPKAPPVQDQNRSQGLNMSGDINQFRDSLLAAGEMGVMMNATGLDSNLSRYVYACGAGLAGSWGKLGKNLSNLFIYVVEDDVCTSSRPVMANGSVSNTTESRTSAECVAENAGRVQFDIRYGPGYSIFTERTAYLFVDENFLDECAFRVREESAQPVLTGEDITGIINGTPGSSNSS